MDLLKNPSCRHKNSNALRGFLLFIQHTVSAFQGYATYALLTHQNTHKKKKSIILTFLEPGCWLRSFVLHCIKFLAQNTFYMQIRASYCRKTRANLLLCQRFAHFSVCELWLAFAQKVKMRSRPSDFFFLSCLTDACMCVSKSVCFRVKLVRRICATPVADPYGTELSSKAGSTH